jgi:predicted transposase YbfD/YdcC
MLLKSGFQVLTESFATLTDPRVKRTRWHKLVDIVMIAVCGAICECNSWEDLPRYGRAKKDWLKGFLELPNGIPSADTFARVFQRLKVDEFLECLSSIVSVLRREESQEVVAIDGQTLRGSGNGQTGRHPLHLVRAWAATNRLVLGQQACAEKSNEITAIPQLLKVIDIEGAIVTIDAMGCQTEIADGIIERKADYVLAVKDNQPTLHTEIRQAFEQVLEQAASGFKPAFFEHVERQKKRGRTEERHYYQLPLPKGSSTFGRWRAAKTIGMVIRSRTIQGCEQLEAHYYLSSLPLGVKRFARAARGHWGIENSLHWTLDVLFAQDASRIRKDSSPEIASMLRQLALMILQRDTQLKGSLRSKRKQAGWNDAYLETLLAQITDK